MRWRWIADFALLWGVSGPTARARAEELARARGCLRLWRSSLLVADALAGAAVPQGLGESDPLAARMARDCALALRAAAAPPAGLWQRGADRRAERAAVALYHLRPWPADWQRLDLPSWLSWAYWLTRPARLAWKHGTRLVRRRAAAAREAQGR